MSAISYNAPRKILVTGTTGYIGSGVVRALVAAGHEVTGTCRTEARAAAVRALGAKPLVLDLGGFIASAGEVLAGFDAVVNAAADKSDYSGADTAVVKAVLAASAARPGGLAFVYTSGLTIAGESEGREVADADEPNTPVAVGWRRDCELAVLRSGGRHAVIRPGMVFGRTGSNGSGAYLQMKRDGAAQVIGKPGGRFPWVHVDDLGAAYAAVLARLLGGGSVSPAVFNAGDGRDSLEHADVYTALSRAAGYDKPVVHVPVEEARATMGPFADLLNLRLGHVTCDGLAALGWSPKHGPPTDPAEAAAWAAALAEAHP